MEVMAAKITEARAHPVAKYMIVPIANPKARGRTPLNGIDLRFFFLGCNFADLLDLMVIIPKPIRDPHSALAISDIAVAKLFKQYSS
jgi:hypothetical protein